MNTPLKHSQFLVQTFAMKAMELGSVENATFVADLFGRLSRKEVTQFVLATTLILNIGVAAKMAKGAGLRFE